MISRGWRSAVHRGSAAAALLCAVGVSLVPGRASAAPAPEQAGSQVNADAKQLFTDGQTATKLLQWDKARTFFQGAWRIQQHWKIAASLGRAELKVGRMREAAEHLAFALREVPAGALAPEDLKPVQEMLTQARSKVGAVKVTGAPDGAEVTLDGALVGKAPLQGELFLDPGPHKVAAQREGYVDGKGDVAAVAGVAVGLDLGMAKVPVVAPVGPVRGGEMVGPPVAKGPDKKVVIAGAVVAAVGLGMGGAFMGLSFAKAGDLDAALKAHPCTNGNHGCTDTVVNADNARADFGNASFYSFIAAGVVGAATLTYVLVPRSAKDGSGTKAAFSAGPGGVGMTMTRSW